jgi:hypothetical protein
VISTGDASNFFLKILVHLTFNANGDLTSQKTEFMPECRG